MIGFDEARRLAEAALESAHCLTGRVATLAVGWAFDYENKGFLATGDPKERLRGVGPLIVDSRNGSVHRIGGALVETHMRVYEDRWSENPPPAGLQPSDGISMADLRDGPTGVGPLQRPFEKKW